MVHFTSMQGSALTARIDPDLPFRPEPSSGVEQVAFDRPGADVLVVRGDREPPAIRGEAVVRVGDAGSAGWLGVPVDLAVGPEELVQDGAAVARRAHALRLALRPD